jgi:hypothetical protein
MGALEIVANGDVAGGTTGAGIYAENSAASAGPLSITSEAKVTGGFRGIQARNYGTGALSITANGDVIGSGGISAANFGTGALKLVANGDVVGNGGVNSSGIVAQNLGGGGAPSKSPPTAASLAADMAFMPAVPAQARWRSSPTAMSPALPARAFMRELLAQGRPP